MSVEQLSDSEVKCYLDDGCARCPFCRSPHIVGHGVVIDAGKASQDMFCNDCEEAWTDQFRLDHVEIYVPDQAA